MRRTTGGDKRSSWLTFQRRLFLVRRLFRGQARGSELIDAARAALGEEIYPLDAAAPLRHDLAALPREFHCVIRFEPGKGYAMDSLGRLALLDLSDADSEALCWSRPSWSR
jgi:hypothetical protein